jgi:hypothetical protein
MLILSNSLLLRLKFLALLYEALLQAISNDVGVELEFAATILTGGIVLVIFSQFHFRTETSGTLQIGQKLLNLAPCGRF